MKIICNLELAKKFKTNLKSFYVTTVLQIISKISCIPASEKVLQNCNKNSLITIC